MKMIFDHLSRHNPKLYLSCEGFDSINNVVWLSGNDQDYKSNLLYVTKASDLLKLIPIESHLNIVCLNDINLDFDAKGNLNLIIVDASSDISNIYKEINTFIVNQNSLHNSSLKLYDALLSGKGLQYILDVGAEVLGNPIMVYNLAYKVLSYSKNIIVKDDEWNGLVSRGYGSYDDYNLKKESFRKVEMADNPVILNILTGKKAIFNKVKIGGKHIGYVSAVDHERPLCENSIEMIELLSKLVANELQKDSFLNHSKGLIYEYLITELLDSKNVNQEYLHDRIKYLDLNLAENLYVLTARKIAGDTDTLPFYRAKLDLLISDSKSLLYNNDLIYLISRKKNKPLNKTDLENALDFLKENRIQAGLSRCFHDISLIRRFYIQSCKAIEIGNRFKQYALLFIYDEFAIDHLLDIAAEQSDLKEFCSKWIFELMEYDKVNHTKFMQTLYVYLICGRDVSKAAHIFNIHRNSMDYRIKKIEEILDIDISDAETHFALYSSIKILSFIKDEEFLSSIKNSLSALEYEAK
ncbi:PucR family transcriptional regulator [Oxobacter pfennigii]|nr:helix-turn-helix domain-containing protein [Oxobacter pfennigii]